VSVKHVSSPLGHEFFISPPPTTTIHTLSLHDALPIYLQSLIVHVHPVQSYWQFACPNRLAHVPDQKRPHYQNNTVKTMPSPKDVPVQCSGLNWQTIAQTHSADRSIQVVVQNSIHND